MAAVALLASVSTGFASGVQTGGGFSPPGGDQGKGGGSGPGGGGAQQSNQGPKSITAQQYISFVSTYYQQFLNQGQTEQQALANAIQLAHNTFQTQLSINQPNGIQSFLESVAMALGRSPSNWSYLLTNGSAMDIGRMGDYGGEAGLGFMALAGGGYMMVPTEVAPLEGSTGVMYRMVAGEVPGAQGGEVAYMEVPTLTRQYQTGAQQLFGMPYSTAPDAAGAYVYVNPVANAQAVIGGTMTVVTMGYMANYAASPDFQNFLSPPGKIPGTFNLGLNPQGSYQLPGTPTTHQQYDANGNLVTAFGPGPMVTNAPLSPWQSQAAGIAAMNAVATSGAAIDTPNSFQPPPITLGFVDQNMVNGRIVAPGYNGNPTSAVEKLAPNGVQIITNQNGNTVGASYTYNSYGAGGIVLSQKTVNYDANGNQTSVTIVNSNGSTTTTYANGSAPTQTPPGTVDTSNWGPQSVSNPGSGSGGASADGVAPQQ
jgi:hypothetical protein